MNLTQITAFIRQSPAQTKPIHPEAELVCASKERHLTQCTLLATPYSPNWNRTKRLMTMFSPIFAIFSVTKSRMVFDVSFTNG